MDAVDTFLSTYPDSPVVLDVLGTLDPDEIRRRVRELEPAADEIFSFGCSVGATCGVRLDDGSRVALKVHTLYRDPEYFQAVALWPKPHNALFDFEATAAGAEWIDEIGARATAVERVGREVVGHLDWAAKHVRFDAQLRPTAVYDWDSVTTELEPVVAGQAAASFTYTEELDRPVARWPAPDESVAFLSDYVEARGVHFDPAERRTARAACVYLLACAARCHHAVGGDPADIELAQHADAFL